MIPRLTIDLFLATADSRQSLAGLARHGALARCTLRGHDGGLAAAATHYAGAPTPQVVVVEDEGGDDLAARLDRLAEVCDPDSRVLLIGGVNDIHVYRRLRDRGVSDYLPRPVSAEHVLEAIRALFHDAQAAPRGKTLAVWGARGGVGASTLAQNLAWAAGRHLREPVIYLDLDLAFGTSLLSFNLEAKQTAADALANPERLDEVLLERYLIEYDEHLRVLAAPADPGGGHAPGLDGVERLLDLARRLAALVVLDLPHQWCDWTRHLLTQADELALVATPDLPNLREVKTLRDILEPVRGQAAAARLVLNRVDAYRKTQLTAKDFAANAGLAPALTLPFDPLLFGDAANRGQMLGECAKTHRTAQALAQFAAQITGKAADTGKPAWSVAGVLQWLKA